MMIDAHCHLEQKNYGSKLDFLLKEWKSKLKFIISSCAHPNDIEKTMWIYDKYAPFVQICIGLHPEFIGKLLVGQEEETIDFIKKHKNEIVAIGEIGLDYHWIKEEKLQEEQRKLFSRLLRLAKELDKPVVIHCWEAEKDTLDILEKEGFKGRKVLLHLFQGRKFIDRVIKNNWFVSIGPSIARSKDIKKIVRDMPLNQIMLETDSPWFKQDGQKYGKPTNVIIPLKKIAEIKKIDVTKVEKQTDLNAKAFFNL